MRTQYIAATLQSKIGKEKKCASIADCELATIKKFYRRRGNKKKKSTVTLK